MKVRLTLAALCAGMAGTAFSLEEPIYTVTTAGEGTNELASAMVDVTQNGETTTEAFSTLTPTTGTFRKRGTGFLKSCDAFNTFTGRLLVEEGAWIATANGHLGQSISASLPRSSVVISNGASVVFSLPNGLTGANFRHDITFGGAGYKDMGAICVDNAGGNTVKSPLVRNATWAMTEDAVIKLRSKASSADVHGYYITFNMNGHTLTFSGFGDVNGDTYNFFISTNCKFNNPGHIVLDSSRWRYANDGTTYSLAGSSANTLTLKGGDNKTKNDAWLYSSQMPLDSPWTLVFENGGVVRSTTGVWGTTNSVDAAWAGPVNLTGGTASVSGNSTNSYTFLNAISGDGGLTCSRGQQINLVNGGNSFKGAVKINTSRDAAHDGELRLFVNGALPAENAGATLYNSAVAVPGYRSYDLPPLTFDVDADKTETFGGCGLTGTVARLTKVGAGTLDMTAQMNVTGVTEIAAGIVRIPYDRAGLIAGGKAYEPGAMPHSDRPKIDTVMYTNRVALSTDLAYTPADDWWIRDETAAMNNNGRAFFNYHGYVWNRSGREQDWTFAMAISQGGSLYLDGVSQSMDATDCRAARFVQFKTVKMKPGATRFDFRFYSTATYGPAFGYPLTSTSFAFTNAVWKPCFGFAVDTQGRGSTNVADFVAVADPGDGSFLTFTSDFTESLPQYMTRFSHLKFTGGTLDTRGSDLTVPVLEGVNGAVTNSNAYFSGGSLTVGEKWRLSGSTVSGKTLKVSGKLKFVAGTALEWNDLSLLPRTNHTLATATDGIEGLPAFDGNAPGNKGWHLKKAAIDGVETLTFFWRLGTMFTIR